MLPHDDHFSAELRALVTRLNLAMERRRGLINELHDAALATQELMEVLRERNPPKSILAQPAD